MISVLLGALKKSSSSQIWLMTSILLGALKKSASHPRSGLWPQFCWEPWKKSASHPRSGLWPQFCWEPWKDLPHIPGLAYDLNCVGSPEKICLTFQI
jgi:hypothetical protein